MKKKLIIIALVLMIIGIIIFILHYCIKTEKSIVNNNEINIIGTEDEYKKDINKNESISISPDEKYIATIYYSYDLGIDASRGFNIFIYRDYNGYKYEIKYGEITEAGPTILKTKGYGRLFSSKDIEDLNNSFKKAKKESEEFSIKYRIINNDNNSEFCELDKFKTFLFK